MLLDSADIEESWMKTVFMVHEGGTKFYESTMFCIPGQYSQIVYRYGKIGKYRMHSPKRVIDEIAGRVVFSELTDEVNAQNLFFHKAQDKEGRGYKAIGGSDGKVRFIEFRKRVVPGMLQMILKKDQENWSEYAPILEEGGDVRTLPSIVGRSIALGQNKLMGLHLASIKTGKDTASAFVLAPDSLADHFRVQDVDEKPSKEFSNPADWGLFA